MSAENTAAVQEIADAYAVDGPALTLGAVVTDETAHPGAQVRLPLSMMNRHGLVAGATGTGKTKTLQGMAEQLSAAGVPVFLADVKGDLSGMAAPGSPGDRITKRSTEVADDWAPTAFPVEFLRLGAEPGEEAIGTPVRATMTSFGPVLLAKVLGLNDTQTSSLNLVFHWADKQGLPLLDLKDLQSVIKHLASDEGKADLKDLGGLASSTAGVLLRELIAFTDTGAESFFGEPEFDTADLLRVAPDGRGVVTLMELSTVYDRPALFSTFLMWLLADLFQDLPEVGDSDKPKLVFFFDEAHLLFKNASQDFLDSIAQTVRLIRSKGVGVFFVTQTPSDVPDDVLAQLGNRVQHALRAFTPDDAKALKATVSTFPRSDVYDLGELLTQLGIGEAVVTVLRENGAPSPVAWTRLRAPRSLMAQLDPAEQARLVAASPLAAEYGQSIDRESAYERLNAKVALAEAEEAAAAAPAPAGGSAAQPPSPSRRAGRAEPQEESAVAAVLGSSAARSFFRSAATVAGREISRSLFGTSKRRRKR